MWKDGMQNKVKILVILFFSLLFGFIISKKIIVTIETKRKPTASISYSTTNPTNQEVIVRLINPNKEIIIMNNEGKDTYIFKENGKFTFEFIDKYGNKGSTTANVNWIKKTPPKLTITYDIVTKTNQDVTAKLDLGENIIITNNEGKNTYTFKENGEFIFEYQDELGNKGSTKAEVDWIDKTVPIAFISFSKQTSKSDAVTATLTNETEPITILNNEGKNFYEFRENGEFTFEYQDEAGNTNKTIAEVNWITEIENKQNKQWKENETPISADTFINNDSVEEETKKPTPRIEKEEYKQELETMNQIDMENESKPTSNYILAINLLLLFLLIIKIIKRKR